MIRINLLPFRAARKRENVRRQVSIFALTVLLSVAGLGYFYWELNKQVSQLQDEEKRLNTKLAEYREEIKRVKELDRTIKDIRSKLEVIAGLEKKKTGPVHLLDEVAMAVPKDALWLNSLEETKGILTLRGTARDNNVVAAFMTNLERSEFIQSVDLDSSRLRPMTAYKMKVSDFILVCKTFAFKEKPKEAPKKKKGRRSKK